ncbi:channel subunit alpha-2/delta [Seminavis robusta]|uniref:Channel subunit alpha-2/delta n=1 Tax=Seminavis robusta TaxID=568900 RepID=A0A9N8EK12_9STRA|nr:channel subunit alpha-2/delta [Seminavis robusta]|eukprot:Sro1111_g242420.1 channel subunit alpha-2/delta (644) ;mRNA; f:8452-10645
MQIAFSFFALFLACLSSPTDAGDEEFNELQWKLETDVLELRTAVEEAYLSRCDPSTLQSCQRGNFDACDSSFPNPVCPVGEDFSLQVCADGCSSKYDYSVSTVSFPPFPGSRDDPAVLQDICFSRKLDSYFVNKYEADKSFWDKYGIDVPSMHLGMTTGAFRIYPARANETCNAYDPRVRPWYVAGSSGPKNIILLLDTSGSMDGIRLYYLKQAAARIIDTLTVGDRVALVPFSTKAQPEYFDGEALVKVTASMKEELQKRLAALEAIGSTNIHDAFRRAFQVMEDSIPLEKVVDCNTAIIFLTDGKMTDPPDVTEESVLEFVSDGLLELEQRLKHPVYLFTYSVSENDDVHTFPKQLACSATANGIWSKVVDERTIVDSLTSYTNLFSLGLGEGRNDDFTAWVEPYIFSTRGVPGVTVSAPVFDRTVNPPVLIGVVGLDLLVEALDRALGVETGSSKTYDRIVLSSTAKCPRLATSQCHMEAFRSFGISGDDARCGGASNCSTTVDISLAPEVCNNRDDLPSIIVHNTDVEQVSFIERACCTGGSNGFGVVQNDTCIATSLSMEEKSKNIGAIVGSVVGVLVGVSVMAYAVAASCRKAKLERGDSVPVAQAMAVHDEETEVTAVTPPTNPKASAPCVLNAEA